MHGCATGNLEAIELAPDPLFEEWVVSGNPITRSRIIATSPDRASKTMVWDCTAGSFEWHYKQDEVLIVIAGDACLLGQNGKERRLAAGDYGFFPAGTIAHWRVDKYIRKVALLHEPMFGPAVPALNLWNKILRKFHSARHIGFESGAFPRR